MNWKLTQTFILNQIFKAKQIKAKQNFFSLMEDSYFTSSHYYLMK